MQALLPVTLRRPVAPALLGEGMDDDGAVVLGGERQDALESGDVVTVDGADIADAEGLEEVSRTEHSLRSGCARTERL